MPVPGEYLAEKDRVFHSRVREEQVKAQVAAQTWLAYLSHAYDLKDGDSVLPDGRIVRKDEET